MEAKRAAKATQKSEKAKIEKYVWILKGANNMTFNELKKMTNDKEFPIMCNNENDEVVFIYWRPAQDGVDAHFQVSTYQNNGWIRDNNYYADGTIEETYKK